MAELNVSKQNIASLLSGKNFIIPDYQRPYKWDEDQCATLWNDVVNFYKDSESGKDEYFFGTVVTVANEKGLNIIDGQQRITSLLLLLRVFYKQLEEMSDSEEVDGLKRQIEPCLWEINSITGRANDKSKIRLESKVATEKDNGILHDLLSTGEVKDRGVSQYSTNFNFFFKESKDYAKDEPTRWYKLCVCFLRRCIIFPIECESFDVGMTIFSTLNNRGLSLSDADIFKAELYKLQDGSERKEIFITQWKEIEERIEGDIGQVFRFYSHYLRGEKGFTDKEMSLREFYVGKKQKSVENKQKFNFDEKPELMNHLDDLSKFLELLQKLHSPDTDEIKKCFTPKALQYLHCIKAYPSEYAQYPLGVYYLVNKEEKDFSIRFEIFSKKLLAFLLAKYLENRLIDHIKTPIYQLCVEVCKKNKAAETVFKKRNEFPENEKISELIRKSRISNALLLLDAYLSEQEGLIPESFQIEHIFPKQWQNTNYNGWTEEEAEIYREHPGNKIVFEKKLNIKAGNNYFGKKKEQYKASKIAAVKKLAQYEKDDWVKEDIEKREEEMLGRLQRFFQDNLQEK